MDATHMATFQGIVGIEYHLQAQLVHLKAGITAGKDYHAPNSQVIDMMTEEAIADLILGLIQETEVGATQDIPVQTDTPAGTENLDEGTRPTATELKADHLTGNTQVAIDHRLPTLGIVLEADPPHAVVKRHPDAV